MRIAELSKRSGVPVPTIKYYLREGMVPPGERTGPNQARYDEGHVRRLRLVRAMTDIGGLSIATIREILSAVDSTDGDLDTLMGTVQRSLINAPDDVDPKAAHEVEEILADVGWEDIGDHPSVRVLAAVIAAARELGHPDLTLGLREYARACERVASVDLDYVARVSEVDRVLEGVVVGTVLGDSALGALRRIAQGVESRRRYGRRPATGVPPARDGSTADS